MPNLPRQPPKLAECLSLEITIEVKKALTEQIQKSLQDMPDSELRQRTLKLLYAEVSNLKWLIFLETLLAQLDLNHHIHNN